MIPKIIHYCWFGPKKLSSMEERCLASWRKFCPDYEIRKWTEKDFDFSTNRYAREAQSNGAWAFLSDYARNLILAEHGGIYLDTDVELCRPLDPLLDQEGFCGVEEDKVQSGLGIGAVPHHPVVEALVKHYDDVAFILPDGKRNMATNTEIQHQVFERFGFSCAKSGEIQTFSGMTAYPPEYFCPKSFRDGSMHKTDNTFSIHHYHASWASPASRIGYHLRRLAGEKVYSLAHSIFHNPEKLIILWCFLLTFIQNLRAVLNAAELADGAAGKILSLLNFLLAGSVIGIQLLQWKKISRESLVAIAVGLIVFAASPWNPALLWLFVMGNVVACFPFRLFARCNISMLSGILLCWGILLLTGIIPSASVPVKKIVWMYFYDFGFRSTNTISLFLFQLSVYSYFFIRRSNWKVLILIPVAIAVFLLSGGRCYALGIIIIAAVHFFPKRWKHFFVKRFGAVICGGMLITLLLGYMNPSWHILYLAVNERVDMWHTYLKQDTGVKSLLFGRNWVKTPPDPAQMKKIRKNRKTAKWEKKPSSMVVKKRNADPKGLALDSAYLQLYVYSGILGVCTFFWLLFLAFKKHCGMLYRLLPVWVAFAFCGFFEAHVLGARFCMLGLLPFYFIFRRKGEC